jgi:adenine-specific DNA-methyltransferase
MLLEAEILLINNDAYKKNCDHAINTTSLSKIPKFRLIGNKHSILNYISEVITKEKIDGKVFFDVFSGSSSVGRYFKQNYSIISNDILYFSYILQRVLIVLNNFPKFKNVKIPNLSVNPEKRINQVLEFLNKSEEKCGFIYNHYTPASKNIDGIERKYFSEENGRKIDAIRMTIDEWFNEKQINEDEYFYLIASLLLAVQKVSNISGTYGAFNKIWDPRSEKPLVLKPIEIIPSNFMHKAFNSDVFNILDKVSCDIAYIDPPYNERQYIANYHILETIAKYDNPKISGKTGIRNYSQQEKSVFCSKKTVSDAVLKLLNNVKAKYIILSYSSDGLISKDEIISLFEKAGLYGIKLYEFQYRRFKSNKNTHKNFVKEYIFVGRKE